MNQDEVDCQEGAQSLTEDAVEEREKKKKLVLIVDDQITILKLTASILEEAGYDAASAINGREALEAMTSRKPDIVILDIVMPEMSGFQVLKELPRSRPPVIACSFDLSSRERAMDLGADDFLAKPYNPEELLEKISDVLDGTGPSDGPPRSE